MCPVLSLVLLVPSSTTSGQENAKVSSETLRRNLKGLLACWEEENIRVLSGRHRNEIDPFRSSNGPVPDEPPGCKDHDPLTMVVGRLSGLHPSTGAGVDKSDELRHDKEQLLL